METITLWNGTIPFFLPDADTPNAMHAYLIDADKPRPAVVIFPGGGYSHRAYHEGEPIAQFYNAQGFQAFVVDYRVTPYRYPAAFADACRAIRLVRHHAAAGGVDPDRVFVCGFSAGGHLAGCTAVLPAPDVPEDDLSDISAKPTGAVLCYAVNSGLKADGYTGSHENLLGDRYDELAEHLSLYRRVDEHTAPCFLWHTAEDQCVPLGHCLKMADALHNHGIPVEVHVFPYGRHGVGLADDPDHYVPGVNRWAALSAEWIRAI